MAFFSTASADYQKQIQNLNKSDYSSQYNNLIQENLNTILNGKKFTYDFNADPLFKNYKEMYSKKGKEANLSAQAEAAANTGGFGNSYGVTAGAAANQAVADELNDRIPELYDAAQVQYQNNLNNLYNKQEALTSEENRLYEQYRDVIGDYYQDYSNLLSGFANAQNQENADRDYDYNVERGKVQDAQWETEFNYRQYRDTVADRQWQASMDYQRARDNDDDYHYDSNYIYNQSRIAAQNSQWNQEYQLALKKALEKAK